MSVFALTKGSEAALGMLARQTGSETLLLTQPARELRASINIERLPAVDAAAGFKLEAELFLRDQRHSMTLQHDDGANAQHLADWVEAVANGTLDTAQAIPQRQSVLLPCCRCEGVAIAYSYLAPAPAQHDLHGVKCRHRDCQSLEGATTAAAAADAWNDIQREGLDEEPSGSTDMVNHPPHYTGHPSGVECIEVAEHLPFCLGNAFKYLFRRDAKGNPLENIEKAIWYVNRHNETYPDKPELPEEAREALGMVVVHEPHPFSTAMLLIAGPSQCGGYDACIAMLEQEAARLRSGAEPLRAA
jgi:hypothetical protein